MSSATVLPVHMDRFFVIGVSYKKADPLVRGRFSITGERYQTMLADRARFGIQELFVVSTCNRTELYAVADRPSQLREALCAATGTTTQELHTVSYQHIGANAVRHLFRVAAGVDSQLLGDYEIVSQVKQAVRTAKEHGGIGVFCDRLASEAMKASKAVRTHTAIGAGTVSVAFAAVRYLEQLSTIADKRILLVGTGKIGRNTGKHLVERLGAGNITVVNRTDAKAEALAEELGVASAHFHQLDHLLPGSDVVLVATNAPEPVITTANAGEQRPQWFLDLSVPRNVHADVAAMPGKTVLNVDQLSTITDGSIKARADELPKAERLIDTAVNEFGTWCAMRERLGVLANVKEKLETINARGLGGEAFDGPACDAEAEVRIQRVLKDMAVNLRERNDKGCQYLSAINAFIGTA